MADSATNTYNDEPGCRIRILGLGGAGCNVIDRLVIDGMPGIDLVAANTDLQALSGCLAPEKIQIGRRVTRGLGAGGDPRRGREAAEEDRDALRTAISGSDVVFLIAGLGGGTGTGALPVAAGLAREEGALTVAFVTEPFAFEGDKRRSIALRGLAEARETADAVFAVPNDKLFRPIEPSATVLDAFRRADAALCDGVRAIGRLLTRPGLVNVDFADVRTVLANADGGSLFVSAVGKDPDKVQDALGSLMASPFLERGEAIAEANRVLLSFVGGPDLTLEEVYRAVEELGRMARPDALVIVGAGVEEELTGQFSLTLLAARGPLPGSEPVVAQATRTDRAEPSAEATLFPLEEPSRGRFEKAEPTLVNGKDLDVPTYIRKSLVLGR